MNTQNINIYATGGDIRSKLAMVNAALVRDGLRLELVDKPELADVRVSFVEVPSQNPEREGAAWPWLGRIEIVPNASYLTLLHEILHCAGVAHEDDQLSVMYRHASFGACVIKPAHIRALRKLPGITRFGRLIAQIQS
jgi:hypothetical protein